MNFEYPNYTPKELQLQWINNIVHTHDLLCKCDKPLEHTIYGIVKQEPNLRLNQETKKLLEKCLTSTESGGLAEDDIDGLGEGDLEALFAEDTGEDTR